MQHFAISTSRVAFRNLKFAFGISMNPATYERLVKRRTRSANGEDRTANRETRTANRFFSSMAWTSVVLAVVVVPLLTLVVDGARLFYVRGRLQTAVDAACEDAAWSAADRRAYRDGGVTTFNKFGGALGSAVTTFNQTLGDQTAKNFIASVSIQPIFNQARMECQAKASIPLVTAGGLFWSPVSIEAQSASIIRFTRK